MEGLQQPKILKQSLGEQFPARGICCLLASILNLCKITSLSPGSFLQLKLSQLKYPQLCRNMRQSSSLLHPWSLGTWSVKEFLYCGFCMCIYIMKTFTTMLTGRKQPDTKLCEQQCFPGVQPQFSTRVRCCREGQERRAATSATTDVRKV